MPAVVAKRNARERTRVHTVNQAFLELKHHLPTLRQFTKRVSKLRILNAAINYIEALVRVIQNSDTSSSSSSTTTTFQHYHTHRHNNHQPSSGTVITKPRALRPDTSLVVPQQQHHQHQHQNLYTTTNMFTPQPSHVHHHLPYMKQLLDYPTSYLTTAYPQQSAINPSGVIVTAASNFSLMPTYQCM